MLINFKLNRHTHFGQNIFLIGSSKKLGSNTIKKAIPLEYRNTNLWEVQVEIKDKEFEYSYFIEEKGQIFHESSIRVLNLNQINKNTIIIDDFWTYSSLPEVNLCNDFFKSLSTSKIEKGLSLKNKNLVFRIKANLFSKHLKLCILGNCKELNDWDMSKPKVMKQVSFAQWELPIKLSNGVERIEYKYGVYNTVTKEFLRFEQGNSRFISINKEDTFQIVNDNNFIHLQTELWKGAGVAVPVFALRSKSSLGVGEFKDLKPLADWCSKSGIQVIQLLPINDTTKTNTWEDSYPYSGISIYALHPQYLNLESIPYDKPEEFDVLYKEAQLKLNNLDSVDYERVNQKKLKFLKEIFNLNVGKIRRSRKFKRFVEENEHWLKPYAAFCVFRDEFGTVDFTKWGKESEFGVRITNGMFRKNSKLEKKGTFYLFLQWQLHEQLLEATEYCRKNKICIKGDIPIGINKFSVESWTEPELFNLNQQAGAPPDDFAVNGQNWEFPTYNWKAMQKDDYSWWKKRFKHMATYFNAFRIDHVLGFFRIWQIPENAVQGTMGYFSPAKQITAQEFIEQGIGWDEKRLTKPFMNKFVIGEMFQQDAANVYYKYFNEENGSVSFKEEYDSQRKINELDEDENIKEKLLEIHANVIFINQGTSEEPKLHPRVGLQNTISFRFLPENIKQKLIELYNDYFYHRNEDLWEQHAVQILPKLKRSTQMLVCAEDLGFVPKSVSKVLDQLTILSLNLQRMSGGDERYFKPEYAKYLSVVSPSSHDTSTLRQWWNEDEESSQFYYNHVLNKTGVKPKELNSELIEKIVIQHLQSPAMLAIFPIQDLLALSEDLKNPNKEIERINKPHVFPHYWNYRMHLNLEDLLNEKEFNNKLKNSILNSGRI